MIRIGIRHSVVHQYLRYICVGVINTLVTLLVIFLCKSILGINPWWSNAIGYVAGVVNSFIWNKKWVFRSKRGSMPEALKFVAGFLICYAIQFGTTRFMVINMGIGQLLWPVGPFTISGYGVATIIGMGIYTVANFVFNKLVTFK